MQLRKNKIKSLLVSLLLIGSINAKANDVLFIEKGTPAPYSGVLFTEPKARELRNDILESSKTELQLESEKAKSGNLLQLVQLKDTEIELYRKQNQRLLRLEDTNSKMNYIWFGLGILATGVAVYGAGGLAR